MFIRPWLEALKTGWIPQKRRLPKRVKQQVVQARTESLEERIVLTPFDLVTVIPNQGVFLSNGAKMYEAPQELTLRFTPGQSIDVTSLSAITVTRAGLDGIFDDPATPALESTDDVSITPGYIGTGDSANEVVVRFASTLADDKYQIRIQATGAGSLVGNAGDSLIPDANKTYRSFNFELDLGALVESVVPQPVIRSLPFAVTNTSSISDGDLITINAGPYSYVFEMDLATNPGVSGTHLPITYSAADTPAQVAAKIAAQINLVANTGNNLTAVATGEQVEVSGTAFEPTIAFTTTKFDAFAKTVLSVNSAANLIDGDLLRLTLNGTVYTFEFNNLSVNNVISGGNTRINYTTGATNTTIAGLIAGAINALPINFSTQQLKATVIAGTSNVAVTNVAGYGTAALTPVTAGTVFSQNFGTLAQATDTVVVYFNQDQLDSASAQNPTYYRLINTTTNAVLLPASVKYQYNPQNGLSAAVLKFPSALGNATYNLKVGITSEPNNSLATAVSVGTIFTTNTYAVDEFLGDAGGAATTSSNSADTDLYKFYLNGPGLITLNVTSQAGLTGVVELLDYQGNVLSGAPASGVVFSGTQSANQAYYARVSSSSGTGGYHLTIQSNIATNGSDNNSSYATSTALGELGASGANITSQIEVQSAFVMMPDQPGGSNEPGHREVPGGAFSGLSSPEVGHGTGETGDAAAPNPTAEQTYSFPDTYGGGLLNQITPEQKEIVRAIFAVFSSQVGIQFREVPSGGDQQIVVGNIQVNAPTLQADQVGGISGSPLIINAIFFAGDNEYGGGFTTTAYHEIGHNLGLGHSYDVPSVQGTGLDGEGVFTGDNDLIHLLRRFPNNSSDIDLYKFNVTQAGTFTAETRAERRDPTDLLNTVLTLYSEDANGVRTVIARNDDFYSKDSGLQIALNPGTYYIGVTSTGNDNYDPSISDSGNGGSSRGIYDLKLGFNANTANVGLMDTTGRLLDGDHDGKAGGEYSTWFSVAPTKFVDKLAPAGGNGTLAAPYQKISEALAAAQPNEIVRIVGNGGADRDESTVDDNVPYQIGRDYNAQQTPLADGATFQVPKDVTVMIDAGALIKLRGQTIDVGTSSAGIDRSHGVLQVLGTPANNVYFTSWRDDAKGSVDDGTNGAAAGGDWGGIVFRSTSDSADSNVFLNQVNHATLQYGGGQVSVDGSLPQTYNVIQLETSRPTITNNIIKNNSDAAISANPDSFKADDGRIGPDIHGNLITQNSTNGLFIRIQTQLGSSFETLNVIARFDDTDITHVIAQNLILNGRPAGSLLNPVSARLMIDPGTVVKLSGARIETGIGTSNLIAEGTAANPIRFTSQQDDRFGAGGTFDLKNNGFTTPVAGSWSGIFVSQASTASLDHVLISYAGGASEIAGNTDNFNPIEVYQGKLRVANSVFENNLGGAAGTSRGGRGGNDSSTIFVRGAQPVIVDNVFRNNQGNVLSINANSLQDVIMPDYGRSTGNVDRFASFDDNYGPLVRLNRFANSSTFGLSSTLGMNIRAQELTIESVWDDIDIAHVVTGTITSSEFHTYGGLRLQSGATGSLVVKLLGSAAGFAATGDPLEISDRIGGSVQIIGQPGFPVILTSLKDDSVSAGFKPDGTPQFDTNGDNNDPLSIPSTGSPGDWNSIAFNQYSNDRNVAIILETEAGINGGNDINSTVGNPQFLGNLAPNQVSGDENRRLGFEVHGFISSDLPGDVDVYSFTATAGTEVWFDTDFTSQKLDVMLELLDSAGTVLARSLNSQTETADPTAWLASGLAGTLANNADPSIRNLNPLIKDPTLGVDFYTTNFHDAGFRAVLPGTAGQQLTYFVRVRSQPAAGQEAAAIPPVGGNGLTSGAYQLQVRLKQVDEIPGSTVRYADIRYATDGIVLTGLPAHSPLMGEAAETTGNNNSHDGAQYLGPLLQTDRNTFSVSGNLSSNTDVDFFSFTVDYSQIQVVIPGPKFFPTVFDIDWADGLTRPDTVIAVYNSSKELIYIGRESDIADDQPAPGQGQDLDDLSRGSLGKLDAYIGSVNLPAGVNGTSETGGVIPNQPPASLQRYYVAVFSNGQLPSALGATFTSAATPEQQRVRLEPINSIKRVVEDHIGFTGYASQGSTVAPVSGPLFNLADSISLSTNIRAFTLSDVNLFVTTSFNLNVVDPFNGKSEIVYGSYGNQTYQDLDMRSDGRLFAVRSSPGAPQAGAYVELNMATGSELSAVSDGIADTDSDPNTSRFQNNLGASTALAIRRSGIGSYDYIYYATADSDDYPTESGLGNVSKLYRANAANGSAAWSAGNYGATGILTDAANTITTATTGMQFLADTLWGVSAGNQLYRITQSGSIGNDSGTNVGNPDSAASPSFGSTPKRVSGTILDFTSVLPSGSGTFAGITDAPQNVENQAYKNLLFIITTTGRLFAVDPTAATPALALKAIFDSNGDNKADRNYIDTNISGATGLAFSPVDFNLWHPTERRSSDTGHGINTTSGLAATPSVDNSRVPSAETVTAKFGNESLNSSQSAGGASMYFGLEPYASGVSGNYYEYNSSGGQLGVQSAINQWDLASNSLLSNTYNVPGGAYGSLVTNSFNLEGYMPGDKPTLYFNYWLQTEGAEGKSTDSMRDSARVYVSVDNGLTWDLIATNNSTKSASDLPDAELPAFASASKSASAKANQQVQELFDSSSWRQARVDLNDYVGKANVKLRFDFSTSGRSGSVIDRTDPLGVRTIPSNDTSDPTYQDDEGGEFGVTRGGANSSLSANRNNFEGFYVDDIIIGFAGRGEMVTSSAGNATTFVSTPTDPDLKATPPLLKGSYQLEIRRGEEYGALVDPPTANGFVTINPTLDVSDRQTNGQTIRVGNTTQDGNTVTISDGVMTKVFEFDTNNATSGTNIRVNITGLNSATQRGAIAAALAAQINATFGSRNTVIASANSSTYNSDRVDLFGAVLVSAVGTAPTTTALGTESESGFLGLGNDYPATGVANSFNPFSSGTGGYYTLNGTIGNSPISGNPDSDFTEVNLTQGDTLNVELTITGGTGTNYVLGLLDANFNIVAFVSNRKLTYTAAATQKYFLGVLGDDGDLVTPPIDRLFSGPPGALASTGNDTFDYSLKLSLQKVGTTLPTPLSVDKYVRQGDDNLERQQGQFIIENNTILNSKNNGIVINGNDRINGQPHPGAALNTPVPNTQGLVTGLYIQNNVIARFGQNGISVTGDTSAASGPAVTPFVKIVNNTIYGNDAVTTTTTAADIILLIDNTITMGTAINNLITNLLQLDTEMQNANIAAKYGLVQFPMPNTNVPKQTSDLVDFATFTAPNAPFRNIQIQGATEAGSDAILEAFNSFDPSTTFNFRPGARPVVILVSDEDDDSFTDAPNALSTLTANDGLFFGIVQLPPSSGDNTNQTYGTFATATGGQLFAISQFLNNTGPFFTAFTAAVVGAIGGQPQGTGISIVNTSTATIMNNVIVNTVEGIHTDSTTVGSTEIDANLFQGNTGDGTRGNNAIYGADTQGKDLFVNPRANNFYPAPGSPLVDSSRSTFNDRASFVAVKNALAIPASPLLAPQFDRFGQLRVDDPDQAGPANQPGLGANPFQDRGAIERADFVGGTVTSVSPADNDLAGVDLDSSVTTIWIDSANIASPFNILTQFKLQLIDSGIGIDDTTVNGSDFLLLKNGVPLLEGTDYSFTYNQNTNEAIFTSVSTFALDSRYQIVIDNPPATDSSNPTRGITDYAGNFLQNNQATKLTPSNPNVSSNFASSLLYFTYIVTNGINDAPVNTAPGAVTVNEDLSFTFSGANLISVTDADAFLNGDGDPTRGTDGGRIHVTLTVPNGTLTLGNVSGLTPQNGGAYNGNGTGTITLDGRIVDINLALSGLTYAPPPEFPTPQTAPAIVPLTITSDDLAKFGLPTVLNSTVTTVNITVNPVNDVPYFTKGPDRNDLEDAAPVSVAWASNISTGAPNETNQSVTFQVTNNTNPGLFSVAPAISPSGVLTYTLAPDANGFADITIRLKDDGGTANGGIDTSATQTFRINVAAVNDVPTFTKGGDEAVLEDAAPVTRVGWATGISAGPADEAGQILTFNVTNNTNPGLFAAGPTISANGTLSYTLAPNANGAAAITITLSDNGGGTNTSPSQTFNIVVTPVNDRPSFVKGPDQILLGDQLVYSNIPWATQISAGPADEVGQTLTFVITGNTDPSLFAPGGLPTVAADGTLSYTLSPTANGETTITLHLEDDGGTAFGGLNRSFPDQTFRIRVTLNDAPSFTKGADQNVLEDSGLHVVTPWATSILAGPPDESGQAVNFIVTNNSNPGLFTGAVTISPTGTLTYTLAPDANGFADITIVLMDDGGTHFGVDTSAPQTFRINVAPVNDVPVFTKGPNQDVLEDAAAQSIAGWATGISAGAANESAQVLTFVVTGNSNPSLFSAGPAVAADGTLTYTLAPNANGTANISIRLTDNGGTANGGVDTSAVQTFTISATAVNDAPSFTKGNSPVVLEDATAQTLFGWATAISAGPPDEAGQILTFNITGNTNPGLFSVQPSITPNGTLSYALLPNANGVATITVTLSDNGGVSNGGVNTSAAQTFDITVTPVNDVPSFVKGPDQNVLEDAPPQTIAGWATSISTGPANESSQTVTFNITSNSNPALFSVQPSIAPDGTLTYTLTPNAFGTANLSVTMTDSGGVSNGGVNTTTTQVFSITALSVNDAPSFTKGNDQVVLEDSSPQSVPGWATGLSTGPANESNQLLNFNVTNNNPALFTVAPAISANGTLTYVLAPNANGVATVQVSISDNGGTANGGVNTSAPQSFTITAIPVNDVPSFVKGNDITVLEDAVPQSVAGWATQISAGPANESSQVLTFNVTGNTNPALFSVAPAISANGTLTYTLAPNANGFSIISINLSDNGGVSNGGVDTSGTQSFIITATAVNDAPTFVKGADQVVLEDAAPQTIAGWATSIQSGPANETGQVLAFTLTGNSNPSLFSVAPAISPNGTLTYTLAPNANGTASISIKLSDNGGTANGGSDTSVVQTFNITATAVNDAPSFVGGGNLTVLEDAVPQTISSWATAISAGPPDEAAQVLTFNVTGNTNPALFSVQPAISSNGTLTYTLAPNANGTANISITLSDSGGTANNGNNTSAPQAFNITVTPVNDAPTFVKGPDQSVLEDAAPQVIPGWATGIAAGPANESNQIVTFNVIGNTNPNLFIVAPAISPNGTLTYTLAPNATGSATITITLSDQGGTADGGANVSTPPQSFVISAAAVPDTPYDIALSNNTLAENMPVGTLVGTLSSQDVDLPNDSFSYSLVSGDGSTDNGSFLISGNQLLTTQSFNFEAKKTYTVRIRTTDSTNLSLDRIFVIQVTDVNEAASSISTAVNPGTGEINSILENQPANSIVGALVSNDPDAGDTTTFTLISGQGATDNALFSIVNGNLVAKQSFNYEAKNAFSIRIRATDANNLTFDSQLTINVRNVNEAPTNINLSNSSVTENSVAGTPVGNFSTVDVDAGDTFTYSLVSGNGSTDNAKFTIVDGELRVVTPPNYEDAGHAYSIRVRSTDASGVLSTEKVFSITILDVNEAPTDITLSKISVDENLEAGAQVGVFSTTDQDVPEAFTYTLVAGALDNSFFTIAGNRLLTNAKFDFETKSSYNIRVQSTDSAGQSIVKDFLITVNDKNDGPVITLAGTTGTTTGRKVIPVDSTATITDNDSPNFNGGKLVVSIKQGEQTGDTLSIGTGTFEGSVLKLSGKSLKLGKTLVATVSGGVRGIPLSIDFKGETSKELFQAVMRLVTFRGKPYAAPRVIMMVAYDETKLKSEEATRNITVN